MITQHSKLFSQFLRLFYFVCRINEKKAKVYNLWAKLQEILSGLLLLALLAENFQYPWSFREKINFDGMQGQQ